MDRFAHLSRSRGMSFTLKDARHRAGLSTGLPHHVLHGTVYSARSRARPCSAARAAVSDVDNAART